MTTGPGPVLPRVNWWKRSSSLSCAGSSPGQPSRVVRKVLVAISSGHGGWPSMARDLAGSRATQRMLAAIAARPAVCRACQVRLGSRIGLVVSLVELMLAVRAERMLILADLEAVAGGCLCRPRPPRATAVDRTRKVADHLLARCRAIGVPLRRGGGMDFLMPAEPSVCRLTAPALGNSPTASTGWGRSGPSCQTARISRPLR